MNTNDCKVRAYETIYILRPELDDQIAQEFMLNIKKFIKLENGKNIKVSCLGRKKLSYNVNKNNAGIFVHHQYSGNCQLADKLNQNLSLNEQVILRQTIRLKNIPKITKSDDELNINNSISVN